MRRQGADAHAAIFLFNMVQARDGLQIDEKRLIDRPLLQQYHQRGAAADGPRLIAVLFKHGHGLSQRVRLKQFKGSNRHGIS